MLGGAEGGGYMSGGSFTSVSFFLVLKTCGESEQIIFIMNFS